MSDPSGKVAAFTLFALIVAVPVVGAITYRSGHDDGYKDGFATARSIQQSANEKMKELGFCRWAEVMAEQWECRP